MSILSFPERGKWGNAKWRGNCSGFVVKDLFARLQPRSFCDPMVGSGTSVEVAKEMGITAFGLDLHSGFNILRQSIVQTIGQQVDFCLSHPPYGGMVKYSGEVWGSAPHPDDLSRCQDDEEFHEKLHQAIMNQREATVPGGVYGIIIGDWRRQGQYTCYAAEQIARMPSQELASVVIKAQHNVMSSSKTYARLPRFPLIAHEYILLWHRPAVIQSMVECWESIIKQGHLRLNGTWKAVVKSVIVELGGKATLDAIYEKVERKAPERLKTNQNWKAKVRQTLQIYRDFTSCDRGVWAMAA